MKQPRRGITVGRHFLIQHFLDATIRAGYSQNALDETDALWVKINYLQQTGRYGLLLSQLTKTNDKSNFLALVLEV